MKLGVKINEPEQLQRYREDQKKVKSGFFGEEGDGSKKTNLARLIRLTKILKKTNNITKMKTNYR